MILKCPLCSQKRKFFKKLCHDCQVLFEQVDLNLGQVGLGQMIDILIETGIDKRHIKVFLEADPYGQGSMMDQITAELTNNLAQGMGVQEREMNAQDVKKIREHPVYGASDQPIEEPLKE